MAVAGASAFTTPGCSSSRACRPAAWLGLSAGLPWMRKATKKLVPSPGLCRIALVATATMSIPTGVTSPVTTPALVFTMQSGILVLIDSSAGGACRVVQAAHPPVRKHR
jgi:hypothetical protein